MKKGFTLVELLVVVLIIGILAAAALPQYEIAVEKAKAIQAIVAVKAWAEALERYYMANGEYPPNNTSSLEDVQDVLDIEVPATKEFKVYWYSQVYVGARRKDSSHFDYMISKTMNNQGQRGLTCTLDGIYKTDENSLSGRLCKMICKTNTLKKIWGSGEIGCEFQ